MADAKVIPCDDDRSRNGTPQRSVRRRPAGGRRKPAADAAREIPVGSVPGQLGAERAASHVWMFFQVNSRKFFLTTALM